MAGSHPRLVRGWGVASLTRDNTSSEPAPGCFGPFRVLHQIGVGVLGPVFRTYEPSHDRLVAVKAFRLDITPEQARDLADELTRLAELQLFHPSIVAPIAAGVEGTVAYLAQEYVAAESLDIAMRHYAPAPLTKVLPFITQLAAAVDFARANGVLHGTLHPRDVFVTPDEARATGFGVAAALASVNVRAPVRRPYSAPERIGGEQWGTPADVFSLAAIACELLTGRRISGTGADAVRAVSAAVQLPSAVQEVLAGALDEDAGRRPPRGLDFAAALEAAAEGTVRSAAPPADVPATPAFFGEDELEAGPASLQVRDEATVRSDESPLPFEIEVEDAAPTPHLDEYQLREGHESEAPPPPEPDPEPEPEVSADSFNSRESLLGVPLTPADTPHSSSDLPIVIDEPRRPGMLPFAAVLIVGVFIGFVAGYGLGSREPAASTSVGSPPPASTAAKASPTARERETLPAGTDVPLPLSDTGPRAASPTPAASLGTGAVSRPAATSGRLVVRTQPAGARVTINGTRRGETPLEIAMPFGTYTIEVERSGYETASRRVALSPKTPEGLAVFGLRRSGMEPAPPAPTDEAGTGTLFVDSRPRGVRVLLDDRFVGTTPLVISGVRAGSHSVRLEQDGFAPSSSTVRVVGGRRTRVAASLERAAIQ